MKPALSLDDIAGAILDGSAVDWNVVESGSAPSDQPVVSQLKTLAALRLVSRRADGSAGQASWGHLRVFERIGRGAFGEVYRAWDTRLDREVALKLLPSVGADSPGSSIIEEGRLLARVRHPNVVTIYGAERIDGRIGLWMELVKGRTLEDTLRDGPAFTPKEVTRIGVELSRAVSAVHAAGLLHRDIKAQNVMVADDGRLVLMDFGSGRELASTSETNIAGTPLYLAPEVLSGAAATLQSEVYSIGVLLYRLLTGDYPVKGRDLTYLRRAHAAREETDSATSSPGIPPRLGRVIARAIDPDPSHRYANADALGAALTGLGRTPAALRTAYALAATVAVIAAGWIVWGQREVFGLKSPTAAPVEAGVAIDAPVIAVMPFKNLSSEPGSDDFVDGLTSEVIRNLSPPLIEGLQVRSQTSSFWFKGRTRNLAAIREQLPGTNLIVEGDVLRDGNRLRINAQLVKIAGDEVLWSKSLIGTLDDVFAFQDQIALAIVNELRLTLGKGQRNYRTNLQAYELYLRARAVRPGRSEGRGTEVAEKLYRQVIAIDPTFAPAYAGLAGVSQSMQWNIATSPSPGMRPAAVRALELDPLLAEAHAATGLTYTLERDWENATTSYERALELNPNLTQIHTGYSDTLVLMGQPERALRLLEQALIMDPLSLVVRRDLAFAQLLNGRFEEAIANARQVTSVDPDFMSDLLEGRALMLAGRPEEAITVWKSRPVNANYGGGWERWLARAYVMTGRKKELDRLAAASRNENAYRQAIFYAGLGDKDRTFEALDRAVDSDPLRTASVLFFPEMKLLLGDPRRDALKKRLKLP